MIKLTWNDVEVYCDIMVSQLLDKSKNYDVIICIARGGLVPSRIISERLNIKNIRFLSMEYYKSPNERLPSVIIRPTIELNDLKGAKVIVIDDVYDSGATMQAVIQMLELKDIYSYQSMVLVNKGDIKDDIIYGCQLPANEWVEFPWELSEA